MSKLHGANRPRMLTRKTHLARPGVFGQHDRPPADLPPDAGGNLPSETPARQDNVPLDRAAQVDELPHFRDHPLAVGQLDTQ